MIRETDTLTYKQNMSRDELSRVLKSVMIPMGVFALGLFTISNFANFGTKLICPLSGAMWIVGFVVAWMIPSMRKEVLDQTFIALVSYYGGLLLIKALLYFVSGVSSEMIAASYNQAIPTASGNAFPGWLQYMLWGLAIGMPVGFVPLQGKRLLQFRKAKSQQKAFGQIRDMRNTNRDHIRHM